MTVVPLIYCDISYLTNKQNAAALVPFLNCSLTKREELQLPYSAVISPCLRACGKMRLLRSQAVKGTREKNQRAINCFLTLFRQTPNTTQAQERRWRWMVHKAARFHTHTHTQDGIKQSENRDC